MKKKTITEPFSTFWERIVKIDASYRLKKLQLTLKYMKDPWKGKPIKVPKI